MAQLFTLRSENIGEVVTYVAFFFQPVPSTILSIALVILKVATPG